MPDSGNFLINVMCLSVGDMVEVYIILTGS